MSTIQNLTPEAEATTVSPCLLDTKLGHKLVQEEELYLLVPCSNLMAASPLDSKVLTALIAKETVTTAELPLTVS